VNRLAWATAAFILALAPRAHALPVTWTIQGTMSGAASELGSLGIVNGTPYTYRLTYDSIAPFTGWNGSSVSFPTAVLALSFESGAFNAALGQGSTAPIDWAVNTFSVGGPVTLQLVQTLESARPSLPLAPPIYSGTGIWLEWRNPSTGLVGFSLGVDPSGVSYSYSVPEPALAPLMLLALLVPSARRERLVADL
jgi:hypothetical protein